MQYNEISVTTEVIRLQRGSTEKGVMKKDLKKATHELSFKDEQEFTEGTREEKDIPGRRDNIAKSKKT